MKTYFVSRHSGAVEWAARQNLVVDQLVEHLDASVIQSGDTVIGILPFNLAAQVCAAGANYLHLVVEVPAELRGRELSADRLEELGAHLQGFEVRMTP